MSKDLAKKTVKVRIAVAVDPKGSWSAYGWSYGEGQDHGPKNHDELLETVDVELVGQACASHFWLTAELPVPEAVEVAAEAAPAGPARDQ